MTTEKLMSKRALERAGIFEECEHGDRIKVCRVKKYVATEAGRQAQNRASQKYQASGKRDGRGPVTPLKPVVGYHQAHKRVRYHFGGPASNFMCVTGCGTEAKHWALKHSAVDLHSQLLRGKYLVTYSLNPLDYEPKCVVCHLNGDAQWRKSVNEDA